MAKYDLQSLVGTEIYNTFCIGDLVRMGVIKDKRRMKDESICDW